MSPEPAFDFLPRAPRPPLDRFVASLWHARGVVEYRRERIAPTGSTVAVFVLGDPIRQTPAGGDSLLATRGFMAGPHDRPVLNEPTGETHAVGIVTTPIGCATMFGVAPTTIRGRVVELDAAWPAARTLRTALDACDGPEEMLDAVEARLATVVQADDGLDRCATAIDLLEADPTRPIADIAGAVGWSHGHLDREFTRVVGLSPRVLARLLRMRRLLADIDVHQDVSWTELAARLGWFDQAHLIRDFKRHTGVTPTQYVAAQRASFSSEEADHSSGFTPEI